MGAFILGVLVGWLAEWIFYTFWMKGGDQNTDCSALETELQLKNKQISSLQSQLASITNDSSSNSNSNKTAALSSTAKTKTVKATSGNKASSKNPSAKKAPVTKKVTSKTTVAKNTVAKKTTAKTKSKVATNKSSTATQKKSNKGDDFTKLSGIGPSMSATLKSLGIDTFQKLAATDDDILRDMLEQSGARMNNNKDAMDSWNEQATVAAKGDFKALKQMQAALKK